MSRLLLQALSRIRRSYGNESTCHNATPSLRSNHSQLRWLTWGSWTAFLSRRNADTAADSTGAPWLGRQGTATASHMSNVLNDTQNATSTSSSSSTTATTAIISAARQRHDKLLATCLDLLDASADTPEQHAICDLVHLLLSHESDLACSPSELFDRVYDALCMPVARSNPRIQRGLRVVLASIVPARLYALLTSADLFFPACVAEQVDHEKVNAVQRPQTQRGDVVHNRTHSHGCASECAETGRVACRVVVLRLAHALLGQLDTTAAAQQQISEEEILAVYLEDFEQCFPQLGAHKQTDKSDPFVRAFDTLRRNASEMMIRAKLAATLTRLCAAFDKDKTGCIDLEELRATATRVLGSVGATELLYGLASDEQGKIRYVQLVARLTQPPE